LKIAIVGCGKRFTNVYFNILKSLGHEIFLWNRSVEKSTKFCKENSCNLVCELKEFSNIEPNLLLCFVPPHAQLELLENLPKLNCKILLETPVVDPKIMSLQHDLGVLEQWPYLPLEQFKEMIYSKTSGSLLISPNPAHDIAAIEAHGLTGEQGSLIVYNTLGLEISKEIIQIKNGNISLTKSIETWASGAYEFVIIDEKGNRKSGRLIKY
jgi:hypothetical protein